jgi:chaperonin cofactor prefoldin
VDDLDDACAEIMLADDDEAVRMKVGDCFWAAEKDAAEAQLEELSEAAKQEHT